MAWNGVNNFFPQTTVLHKTATSNKADTGGDSVLFLWEKKADKNGVEPSEGIAHTDKTRGVKTQSIMERSRRPRYM